ncbi:MAG: hypothetical protein WBN41_13085 [Lysobacterales bacterium]
MRNKVQLTANSRWLHAQLESGSEAGFSLLNCMPERPDTGIYIVLTGVSD